MDANLIKAYLHRVDGGYDAFMVEIKAAHDVHQAIDSPTLIDWIADHSMWKVFLAQLGEREIELIDFGEIKNAENNLITWHAIYADRVSAALGRPAIAQPYARFEDSPPVPSRFDLPEVEVETGIGEFAIGAALGIGALYLLSKRKTA